MPLRWVWVCFGLLFVAAGVVCLANPEDTFAALADILGFLFLLVGVWWMVRAFLEWAFNPLWWLGLVAGILMSVLAFWTAGQFFIEKAYILLVFAGIWALMEGIGDIGRASPSAGCIGRGSRRVHRARAGAGASSPRSRARATASPRLWASSLA